MIYDQFGSPIHPRRVCGFVAPPVESRQDDQETVADAIASQAIYPDEEVSEL